MNYQVRHSHMSVSLSQHSRLQQSQMKQNYHRKPIFKRNDHKTNSRISIRDSMIINSHSGDQTTCPQQQQQQKTNILQPQRFVEYRSLTHKNQHKNFTIQQSSDQSDKFQYKKPQKQLQSSLINYPAIKITNYSRIFGTPKKSIKNTQRRYFSVQKTSNSKQAIIQDRIQIQNQLLKNQQFLLTQVLISNQRKLRQLQKLQSLETLNIDYKRKMYDAKLTIQKWTQESPNSPILRQLLNVLSF